jgi:PKD repeat protein
VLYTGDGQLGFSRSKIIDSAFNYSVGADAADFNNDGHADFVVAPFSYYDLQIFYVNLGRGDGTFETLEFASYDSARYWGVAAGDFDGDGIVDLVATRASAIDLYLGVGDGTFDWGNPIEDPAVYSYSPVDNYDFDGDGVQDIVIGMYGTEYPQKYQDIGVFRGDGEGRFSHAGTIPGVSGSYPYTLTAPPHLADNISPVAVIDPAVQTIMAGEAATFNADASFDEDGEIVSYTWNFGDQIPTLARHASQGPSAQHVFYEAGLHTITLTVTDNMGATSSVEAQVRVDPLAVKVRLTPRVIKPGRGPKWVRATIWLPRGYDASKIDPGSVCIVENQQPVLYAHPQRASKKAYKYAQKRISRRYQVKFKRRALLKILDGTPGRKKLQVQGKMSHNGGWVSFEGVGNIRTIKPHKIIKPDKSDKVDKKMCLDKKRNKMQKLIKKFARIWSGWLKRHR